MIEYRITFDKVRDDTVVLPAALLQEGKYLLTVSEHGDIVVQGNCDGLLFLAEVLARHALGGFTAGFHTHLPLDSSSKGPNTDGAPELTIYGAEAAIK